MLELLQVHCARGRRRLFAGLSLRVQPGEILHVTGANGAGKTTLLRVMCGLTRPEAGGVRWRGRDIRKLAEQYAGQLVYIGHAPASKAELSPRENLGVALALQGIAASGEDIASALRGAGLAASRETPAGLLSQGQRRRLALARLACSSRLPLWILDEPFTALDADARAWLRSLITDHADAGGLVVLTSHEDAGLAHPRRQAFAL